MTERFPSLEDFDSGAQTQPRESTGPESTGADDFLSREKALLGEDANQFITGNDIAGLMDHGDDDILGGEGHPAEAEEITNFESSFPALNNTNDNIAPGGQITSSYSSSYPSSYIAPSSETEPEVVRQWRQRRDLQLSDHDEKSSARRAETVKAAQQAIDDFYDNYNVKKDKTIAQSRREAEEFLANREDTSAGGTSWERIAKLVDLSGKGARGGASGTGKEKFRELLMGLRKDERAPGATGI